MSWKTRALALPVLAAAIALASAGCGGGSTNESPTSTEAGAESGAAVVSLGSVPKLGMVLVDAHGLTLYGFDRDTGSSSTCYGGCAEGWPPLLTEGEPAVGNGAIASKLGTTERRGGSIQVTYAGHPLYTFVGDKKPGEANGHDAHSFGAQWGALRLSGEDVGS